MLKKMTSFIQERRERRIGQSAGKVRWKVPMLGWACAGDPQLRRPTMAGSGDPDSKERKTTSQRGAVYREENCVSVTMSWLDFKPGRRSFALEVRGDSMMGRHIVDGDVVVFEHGLTPKDGDIVAALIDNRSAVKTFVIDRGRPALRAENPLYPALIPADELVIQGVAVALVRKRERF